jgi:hypothetical protein
MEFKSCFRFFKDQNQVEAAVRPEDVLDRRFAEHAVQQLAPYQRPGN